MICQGVVAARLTWPAYDDVMKIALPGNIALVLHPHVQMFRGGSLLCNLTLDGKLCLRDAKMSTAFVELHYPLIAISDEPKKHHNVRAQQLKGVFDWSNPFSSGNIWAPAYIQNLAYIFCVKNTPKIWWNFRFCWINKNQKGQNAFEVLLFLYKQCITHKMLFLYEWINFGNMSYILCMNSFIISLHGNVNKSKFI